MSRHASLRRSNTGSARNSMDCSLLLASGAGRRLSCLIDRPPLEDDPDKFEADTQLIHMQKRQALALEATDAQQQTLTRLETAEADAAEEKERSDAAEAEADAEGKVDTEVEAAAAAAAAEPALTAAESRSSSRRGSANPSSTMGTVEAAATTTQAADVASTEPIYTPVAESDDVAASSGPESTPADAHSADADGSAHRTAAAASPALASSPPISTHAIGAVDVVGETAAVAEPAAAAAKTGGSNAVPTLDTASPLNARSSRFSYSALLTPSAGDGGVLEDTIHWLQAKVKQLTKDNANQAAALEAQAQAAQAASFEHQRRMRLFRALLNSLLASQLVKSCKTKHTLFRMQEMMFELMPTVLKEYAATPSRGSTYDSSEPALGTHRTFSSSARHSSSSSRNSSNRPTAAPSPTGAATAAVKKMQDGVERAKVERNHKNKESEHGRIRAEEEARIRAVYVGITGSQPLNIITTPPPPSPPAAPAASPLPSSSPSRSLLSSPIASLAAVSSSSAATPAAAGTATVSPIATSRRARAAAAALLANPVLALEVTPSDLVRLARLKKVRRNPSGVSLTPLVDLAAYLEGVMGLLHEAVRVLLARLPASRNESEILAQRNVELAQQLRDLDQFHADELRSLRDLRVAHAHLQAEHARLQQALVITKGDYSIALDHIQATGGWQLGRETRLAGVATGFLARTNISRPRKRAASAAASASASREASRSRSASPARAAGVGDSSRAHSARSVTSISSRHPAAAGPAASIDDDSETDFLFQRDPTLLLSHSRMAATPAPAHSTTATSAGGARGSLRPASARAPRTSASSSSSASSIPSARHDNNSSNEEKEPGASVATRRLSSSSRSSSALHGGGGGDSHGSSRPSSSSRSTLRSISPAQATASFTSNKRLDTHDLANNYDRSTADVKSATRKPSGNASGGHARRPSSSPSRRGRSQVASSLDAVPSSYAVSAAQLSLSRAASASAQRLRPFPHSGGRPPPTIGSAAQALVQRAMQHSPPPPVTDAAAEERAWQLQRSLGKPRRTALEMGLDPPALDGVGGAAASARRLVSSSRSSSSSSHLHQSARSLDYADSEEVTAATAATAAVVIRDEDDGEDSGDDENVAARLVRKSSLTMQRSAPAAAAPRHKPPPPTQPRPQPQSQSQSQQLQQHVAPRSHRAPPQAVVGTDELIVSHASDTGAFLAAALPGSVITHIATKQSVLPEHRDRDRDRGSSRSSAAAAAVAGAPPVASAPQPALVARAPSIAGHVNDNNVEDRVPSLDHSVADGGPSSSRRVSASSSRRTTKTTAQVDATTAVPATAAALPAEPASSSAPSAAAVGASFSSATAAAVDPALAEIEAAEAASLARVRSLEARRALRRATSKARETERQNEEAKAQEGDSTAAAHTLQHERVRAEQEDKQPEQMVQQREEVQQQDDAPSAAIAVAEDPMPPAASRVSSMVTAAPVLATASDSGSFAPDPSAELPPEPSVARPTATRNSSVAAAVVPTVDAPNSSVPAADAAASSAEGSVDAPPASSSTDPIADSAAAAAAPSMHAAPLHSSSSPTHQATSSPSPLSSAAVATAAAPAIALASLPSVAQAGESDDPPVKHGEEDPDASREEREPARSPAATTLG